MTSFPKLVTPKAPPIKTQGIKTKLVPFILSSIKWTDDLGRWVEPFLGSAVVALNARSSRVLAADANPHIINFYQAIYEGKITPNIVRNYLEQEGQLLKIYGEQHYYDIRHRFNNKGNPLDFLFLSRSCFNGIMRFNRKGHFNVPFCRKPERFRPALITKISNQVAWTANVMADSDWEFRCQPWQETLQEVKCGDFIYCDPPYIGRHADYFSQWSEEEASSLASALISSPTRFAYSMWASNRYRENIHLKKHFNKLPIAFHSHFYHVGSTERLRNEMLEALVVSPNASVPDKELMDSNTWTHQLALI